jgi:hypothetical protein
MESAIMQVLKELLAMFSEEELRFLTSEFKEVHSKGFGSVTVQFHNSHPDIVSQSSTKKFPKPPRDYKAE